MRELLTEAALFLGQDLLRTGDMPVSEFAGLHDTAAFKAWKQARDNDAKLPEVLVKRLDGLARQLQSIGKQLAR